MPSTPIFNSEISGASESNDESSFDFEYDNDSAAPTPVNTTTPLEGLSELEGSHNEQNLSFDWNTSARKAKCVQGHQLHWDSQLSFTRASVPTRRCVLKMVRTVGTVDFGVLMSC